ncbi:capsule assembly Wzi family protein [Sediminibacterium roseum]|uniref:Capsule assembly Wzi family protein n=1 Tax=Sediminibacterium roseum TaxID=1978412 RepID=A0ABW9ZS35_9BACT|nr:capsule assembly Wzi family protein [Sediminibacterium roseum]NCI49114.1 capsule assembly Wzi family protein [Sediminibacterium roseum]
MQTVVFLLFMATGNVAHAQQGLLQQVQLDDYYRRRQITGTDSIPYSFFMQPYAYRYSDKLYETKKDTSLLRSVVGYTIQNNSLLPYGYNDETLMPASGFQQRITAGIYFETKNLSIRIQPEFVYAANTVHDELIPPARADLGNYFGGYFAMLGNKIDMPFRFGDAANSKSYWGQSSLRYRYKWVSVGLSSESMWWGPGRYNALIMGNNAPGFLHGTASTTRPVNTPLGRIEAEVIYGGLKASGFAPAEYKRIAQLGCPQCYEPPLSDSISKRYAAGFVFAISPGNLTNLHIGLAFMSYFYRDSSLAASQLSSLFLRYTMPKDNAEIYAEYGRSDRLISPLDLFKDSVPYAYTLGIRKMIPMRNKSFISITGELTQLGLPKARLIFDRNNIFGPSNLNSYSWYTSATIRHGYTNDGQVMGASIGPGSNSQTIDIAWVQAQNQLGLKLQRVVHNTDFYYYRYFNGTIGGGNTDASWVDVSGSLYGQLSYRQFLFAGSIDYLKSINYKWQKLDGGFAEPSSLSDKKNFQVRLSVLYNINWISRIFSE